MDNTFTAITSFSLTPTTLDINVSHRRHGRHPDWVTSVAVTAPSGPRNVHFGGTGPEASSILDCPAPDIRPRCDGLRQPILRPDTSSNNHEHFTDYPSR